MDRPVAPSKLALKLRRMSESGIIVRVELHHRTLENSQLVQDWPLPKLAPDYIPMANEILDVSQEYADGAQVRCEMVVLGMTKSGVVKASTTWRQRSETETPETALEGSDLVPTNTGLLSQMMKHQEITMRLLLGNIDSLLRHNREELAMQRGRVKELEAARDKGTNESPEQAADRARQMESLGKAASALAPLGKAITEVVMERMGMPGAEGSH